MITASRVRDTRKPVTSRSAVAQAQKARETLATAKATLEASGDQYAASLLGPHIKALTAQIAAHYQTRS
ncbi:hypothetical protein SEA_VINCENZO_96 [Mycobacterium phage Vincenzo]|uniref:Uncharacterized protein n=2 Tax=Coopervirus vincenzo TaxID=1983110 RepID=A0A0F6YQ70_9CAUD|nr:hypothetical protein SEA_VINCENZO_96 [Mycobacterium phage Vincenzo]AKF14358.1 hypothetical protein SEA_VINCENZO_96 [Mycobacterium phage Vincenzo]AKF14762.1 hypothetical protein SEA_ALANGRANT_97 [Mycobacterium phage AlanGrant]